jgi:hypothetical protein
MTVVAGNPVALLLQEPTTWRCVQFVADGLTVACSADMCSALSIDTDGSATFTVAGSAVTGAIGDDAVFVGTLRTDAPWGRIAGSYEDRICQALTGRLRCERTGDRLTLSNDSAVLHFAPGR